MENKWPNFGRFDGVSADRWWNEVFIQSFARSSPFSEAYVRRALTLSVTSEIYDWFSTNEAWDVVPGTVEGLTELTDTGLHLAILSNSDERTPVILKALNLDKFFTVSLLGIYAVDSTFRRLSQSCLSLLSSLGAVLT